MKMLKKLGAILALTLVFAFAAFADCQPPAPGIMETPPCPTAPVASDDPVLSAETSESSASTIVAEISETTIDVFLSALSIF